MSHFEPIDATLFRDAPLFYEIEFISLMEKILMCFNKFLSTKELLENDEEFIRDYFYLTYFRNQTVRKEIELNYHFDCEPKEFGVAPGYLDLKVFGQDIFANPEAYYIIECKRLDDINQNGITGLNAKYITEGIVRFVEKKYSIHHRVNGMIGFIVSNIDIDKNVGNINFLLDKKFPAANAITTLAHNNGIGYQFFYDSTHKDIDGTPFNLFHLMINLSNNLKPII